MTASDSASQNPPADSGYASKILECDELDDYLSSLLLPQVLHAIKYFPLRLPASDIKTFLSFLTLCISVKRSENTPACKALGLKLAIPKKSVYSSVAIYALLKLILPSFRAQFQQQIHRNRTANSTNPEENSTSAIQLARQRRQKLIGVCLKTLDGTIPLLRLLLILKCWAKVNTVSAIPNLEKWLSGLEYQTTTSSSLPSQRSSIHVLYAHRRWMHRWLQACVPIVVLPLLHSARESRELLSNWMEYVDLSLMSSFIHCLTVLVLTFSVLLWHT
jgi:hypothetical protein